MLDILTFFDEDRTTQSANGIVVYDFKDTQKDAFIQCVKDFYREAFISDEDLQANMDGMGTSRYEEIDAVLPTDPIIKSGDFGEILAYAIFTQLNPEYNVKPLRWRWKEERDRAVHFADIMLLSCPNFDQPATTDKLMTIEVKTRATKPDSNESSVNNAIKGALKDTVTRGGKTLLFLQQRLKKDRDFESAKAVRRFEESVQTPFEEYHHAIAIVERDYLGSYHIGNIDANLIQRVANYNSQNNANSKVMHVFVVPLKELKKIYEKLYEEIRNS